MPRFLRTLFSGFDGILFLSLMSLAFFGLATMYSHVGENAYFNRQLVWVCFSTLLFFLAIVPDYRFLRTGNAAFFAYLGIILLVFLQPDFGSAMIIFLIWFGMVLVAGIKFRHVAVVFLLGAITLTALWQYAFYDYQ